MKKYILITSFIFVLVLGGAFLSFSKNAGAVVTTTTITVSTPVTTNVPFGTWTVSPGASYYNLKLYSDSAGKILIGQVQTPYTTLDFNFPGVKYYAVAGCNITFGCSLFSVPFPVSFKKTTVSINGASIFSSDSIYPLNIKNPVYSLSISADINLKSDDSLIRVILLDTKRAEYLVYETYSLIADSNTFSISNTCQESCSLDGIIPVSLKIQIINATIKIKGVNSSNTQAKNAPSLNTLLKTKELATITKLNQTIKKKKFGWVAGKTSVSGLSYEQKKKMFTNPDGTPIDKLPNLQGFEYYKGGVFKIFPSAESQQRVAQQPITPVILPSSWDWRNVNGQNWNTPVKNQGSAGTCAFFGSNAALESSINLYFNQHLDVDLSEMAEVQCGYGSNLDIYNYNVICTYINLPGQIICQARDFGIPDEVSYPYNASNINFLTCNINPNYNTRLWGVKDFEQIMPPDAFREFIIVNGETVYYNDLLPYGGPGIDYYRQLRMSIPLIKSKIIKNGPLVATYQTWGHVMAVEGWGTDVNNQTYFIFKNSWGTGWGEAGYGNISINNLNNWTFGVVVSPIHLPADHSSWPIGFDGKIYQISYWPGKVNQHTDPTTGAWMTDPDGTSGANINQLTYCKKWYPNTTSVIPTVLNVTINTWHNAGNVGNVGTYTNTTPAYTCVQPPHFISYPAQTSF